MNQAWSVILYVVFAAFAICLNMFVQNLMFALWPLGGAIFVAMPVGAGVALLTKYFLDRRYVFASERSASRIEFLKYALTGGFITAVFFVTEYAIWIIYQTDYARNVGIVIGMTVGYTLKYVLDRHFIFTTSAKEC